MSLESPTPAEIKTLRTEASRGDINAMNALAVYLHHGNGIIQDRGEAIRWYRAAALKGHPQSQHHLGHCYLNGEGVKHDRDAAEGWFRRSAEAGYLRAMVSLAGLLIQRAGGDPADLAEPLALLAQAGAVTRWPT